ncbi:MAG: HD domain-containing protein [Candidatus Omnitrophica bacterium]|nr:HD domain-containing protein [Candidatus Omnitrophota bacterium]
MAFKCPGSTGLRQPKPEEIKCPSCGAEVEMWTDEVKLICPGCKNIIRREMDLACLEWCKYGKECVGEQAYNTYMANKELTIKEKLVKELEEYFGSDTKRIIHAKNVLGFAEELLKNEKADWQIVIPASILHDVGIKAAEEKYGSSAGRYQEKEGPDIAKKILMKAGLKKDDVDEICNIIANHHSPGKIDSDNFRVLYDADWLVNLKEEADIKDKDRLKALINKIFLTQTGKAMAKKIYNVQEEK